MTIYKLEEDPTIFITPTFYGNKFVYRMAYVRATNNRALIRSIDLRKDKLTVHGTEIKESKLQRLHDSLTLDQRHGHIFVNCNGACYFLLLGKLYKSIHNVVFDWSPFDVAVPNSINESLSKELIDKDKEIEILSRQMLSTIASYEDAKNEAKELKEEVLAHVKAQKDKEMELQKVNERLSLDDFELKSNKIELESCKKAVLQLQDQLSKCTNECHDVKNELQNQLSLSIKANDDFVIQLKNLEQELSSTNFELDSKKSRLYDLQDQLESTKELKNECKEEHHKQMCDSVQKLSNDLQSIDFEVKSSNRKLEQALISMLWNELVPSHQFQPRQLMGLGSHMELNRGISLLVSSEDEVRNSGFMGTNNRQIYDLIKIEEIEDDN
ncbi:hypothetical protein vseg_001503 [Gypsophila vaccaria]